MVGKERVKDGRRGEEERVKGGRIVIEIGG